MQSALFVRDRVVGWRQRALGLRELPVGGEASSASPVVGETWRSDSKQETEEPDGLMSSDTSNVAAPDEDHVGHCAGVA